MDIIQNRQALEIMSYPVQPMISTQQIDEILADDHELSVPDAKTFI